MALGRASAVGQGGLQSPVPEDCRRENIPFGEEGSWGSREPQVPSSTPESRASRRSRRVASDSFHECPADRIRGLAEFWSNGDLLQTLVAQNLLLPRTLLQHGLSQRTDLEFLSGDDGEWCQRTRRHARRHGLGNSAESVRPWRGRCGPIRGTGCSRVGSFGDFSHHRELGHVAATARGAQRSGDAGCVGGTRSCGAAARGWRADDARRSMVFGAAYVAPARPAAGGDDAQPRPKRSGQLLSLARSRWAAAASTCIPKGASLLSACCALVCLEPIRSARCPRVCTRLLFPLVTNEQEQLPLATARGRATHSGGKAGVAPGRSGRRIQSRHPTNGLTTGVHQFPRADIRRAC